MIWDLSEAAERQLRALPETGMGFQWVSAVLDGMPARFLVFNSRLAFDVTTLALRPGDDPATILNNSVAVLEAIRQQTPFRVVGRPGPYSFALLSSRVSPAAATPVVSATPSIAPTSSLVKKVALASTRAFHRYSAYKPDRRVDPVTGNFLPGTYAVPESEVPFIPTGFAAVGRLALPNVDPASYRYVIEAPSSTRVEFGTVAPAFGQAGGGVEAYFPNAVANQHVPAKPVVQIPDE